MELNDDGLAEFISQTIVALKKLDFYARQCMYCCSSTFLTQKNNNENPLNYNIPVDYDFPVYGAG